jgi:hypothetical protein
MTDPLGSSPILFARHGDAAVRNTRLTIVLDTAWTPVPEADPHVIPIRRLFASAVESADLFEEALELTDDFADRAELADRLLVEGTTYWFRVRETTWRWLHERLLWLRALAPVIDGVGGRNVVVPEEEAALIDVLRALGADLTLEPVPGAPIAAPTPPDAARKTGSGGGLVAGLRRRLSGAGPIGATPPSPRIDRATESRDRERLLDARVRSMAGSHRPRVVALTTPATYQRVGEEGARRDPHLGSVIPRLADLGLDAVLVGMGLDHRKDADWAAVTADERLLPQFLLRTRWADTADPDRASVAAATCREAIAETRSVELRVDGVDIAPALLDSLSETINRIVDADVNQLARVERLFAELEPRAVLLTQEGIRTPWLMAGHRAGVPMFAVQHGVLYQTHPGYPNRRHPALTLPTRTFVYGDYERRVLLAGAYRDDEVQVSGSPRLDLDTAHDSRRPDTADRDAVRSELGVAPTDTMLVVSTVNLPFVRRSHLVHMIERLLGGPLPGVHLVFKQHPGERDEGPYRQLLAGLARAGGYELPPISVVRDVDLYRLLRAADAHLGLHSTVLTDAVAAGTPNLIALVEGHRDLLGYVAAGVARPVRSIDDLREALASPQPLDPRAREVFLDDHFRLGDTGRRIAQSIEEATASPAARASAATVATPR